MRLVYAAKSKANAKPGVAPRVPAPVDPPSTCSIEQAA